MLRHLTTNVKGRPFTRVGAPDASSRTRRRQFSTRRGLTILSFMLPAAIFVGVFTYYPMIAGSQMAFRNWNLNNLTDTSWVGFGNFAKIFADPNFYVILWNSVVWIVASIVSSRVAPAFRRRITGSVRSVSATVAVSEASSSVAATSVYSRGRSPSK